jgi:hypothetical protein
VRTGEWISVSFYALLAVTSAFTALPAGRRSRIVAAGLAGALFAWSLRLLEGTPQGPLVRDLMPALLLLIGYWQSGQFFRGPNPRIQDAFRAIEQRWFSWVHGLRAIRWLDAYLEWAYLGCYVLIPLGVIVLHATGHPEAVDRFWTVLLVPTFICHGCTVFVPSLPPWLADPGAAATDPQSGIRSFSTWLLEHASIRANTFPSGHVASSFGAALVVLTVSPVAGLVFLWIAGSIALATTALRYHYALDAVLGVALALLAFVLWG